MWSNDLESLTVLYTAFYLGKQEQSSTSPRIHFPRYWGEALGYSYSKTSHKLAVVPLWLLRTGTIPRSVHSGHSFFSCFWVILSPAVRDALHHKRALWSVCWIRSSRGQFWLLFSLGTPVTLASSDFQLYLNSGVPVSSTLVSPFAWKPVNWGNLWVSSQMSLSFIA